MSEVNYQTRADGGAELNRFKREAVPLFPKILRRARWLSGNAETAEDLAQETFLQAWQSFHRFGEGTNARAWLLTILKHRHLNACRKEANWKFVAADEIAETLAANESVSQDLGDKKIINALRGLAPQYRTVVWLADVEDSTYREIAETLQIPIGTVMSRLSRGRAILRGELRTYAESAGYLSPAKRWRREIEKQLNFNQT